MVFRPKLSLTGNASDLLHISLDIGDMTACPTAKCQTLQVEPIPRILHSFQVGVL